MLLQKCIQDVDPVSRLRRSADAEALLEGRQTRRNVTIGPYHVSTPEGQYQVACLKKSRSRFFIRKISERKKFAPE